MVEFLTFFLGLTSGMQAIELNVAGPVATVEVLLDGETVATLDAAPWVVDCDLGDGLLPHDLVAIARDAHGRELDRAEQWINMVARRSAASLAVSADAQGHASALRVDWESIGELEPEQLEVTFDGRPLEVTDPGHIPLPAHDDRDFHYASADLEFSKDRDRRDAEFGGLRTQKISTQLTAVAVRLEGRSGLPPVTRMRSWFLERGEPLDIHGIEKGPMDLFVVRGPGAQAALDELARALLLSHYQPNQGPDRDWRDWDPETYFSGEPEVVENRIRVEGYRLQPLRQFAAFHRRLRLHFVSPIRWPLTPGGLGPEMFAHSRTYAGSEGGLSWLAQMEPPASLAPSTAGAVAVAGLMARTGNRRRAVLLITAASEVADESHRSALDTRVLLHALQVPFYVWSFGASDPEWGGATDLGGLDKPRKAAEQLRRASVALQSELKDQRIVWLEGRHLPQQIELGAEARGLRLAGM